MHELQIIPEIIHGLASIGTILLCVKSFRKTDRFERRFKVSEPEDIRRRVDKRCPVVAQRRPQEY